MVCGVLYGTASGSIDVHDDTTPSLESLSGQEYQTHLSGMSSAGPEQVPETDPRHSTLEDEHEGLAVMDR